MIRLSTESLKARLDTLILVHKTHRNVEELTFEKISLYEKKIHYKDEFNLTIEDKYTMDYINILEKEIESERKFFEYLYKQCFPDYNTDG